MPVAASESEGHVASSSPQKSPSQKSLRNRILCRVTCIDGTVLTAELQKNAKGLDLMSRIVEQLNIQEREYFGLLWTDETQGEKYWLNPQKEIKKQLKGTAPNFQFCVKFYEPVPSQLKTDYTRYLLCLQIRDDINTGRLPCSFAAQALLGSYVVQAEYGDFDPRDHRAGYLDGMMFAPNQTIELLDKIRELHKQHRGMAPYEADTRYLEAARRLAMYGVDAHPAKDTQGEEVLIGVSHIGVLVYRDNLRINKFPWPKVTYIAYKRRNFHVRSRPGEFDAFKTTMVFKLATEKAAKRLYKSCVEHHTFFRLSFPDPPKDKGDLFKLGSKFRYSDRTLYQLRKEGFPINQDNQPTFSRVNSRNFSERYRLSSAQSTTEHLLFVDDEDDTGKKRPYDSSLDRPDKRRPLSGVGTLERKAPLSEEERMATMTQEERDEYRRKIAERLKSDRDLTEARVTTTTTTTTTYLVDRNSGSVEAIPLDSEPIQASGIGSEKDEDKYAVAYGEEKDQERLSAQVRVQLLEQAEDDKRREEEEERNKNRPPAYDAVYGENVPEPDRAELTKAGRRAEELPITVDTARHNLVEKETPVKEEEPIKFGIATPTVGTGTLKRAEVKLADTDSYKGRVERVSDSDKPKQPPKPPERRTPVSMGPYETHSTPSGYSTRTMSTGRRERDVVESAPNRYATLPARGTDRYRDNRTDEERRRSAEDLLEANLNETDRYRRAGSAGVPLVTKEELVRIYSPRGEDGDAANLANGRDTRPEIRNSLRDDLHLTYEQGERGFVREQIKRQSGEFLDDPQIITKTMTITAENDPRVIRQTTPPEVKTKTMTISSVGSKQPVNEDNVQISQVSKQEDMPSYQLPGGDFLVPIPPEEMNHLSKSPCRDQDESFFFTPLPQTKPKRQYGGPTVDETVEKTELDRRRRDDFVLPTVPTHSVIFDPIGGKAFAPPSWEEVGPDGAVITHTVMIDGQRPAEQTRTETIHQVTMPTEIITKTITIEGDGTPLTAQELRDIMAQQAGDSFSSEQVVTRTYTSTQKTHTVTRNVSEQRSLVDEHGNILKTGDIETDRAIEEALAQARAADPNVKVSEIIITQGPEDSSV